ncbi:MAG: fructose-bisphosphate aldolase [Cyanobacteria bacterium P01_H01_bin.74]
MSSTTLTEKITPLKLSDLEHLSTGKKARLHRLMYQHGPGNGTMMFLPIDQGLEHGPVDFFENPDCADPNFQFQLALNGNYSAIAVHIGLAEKYLKAYAGKVPLVLKLNGKTNLPSSDNAFSTCTGTVEDAVRLGADAIGYTLYVGSPSQDIDIEQFCGIRKEAERYGMPIIIWAYPRGSAVKANGGQDSPYAIEYAARVACEVGADVVKINYPKVDAPGIENSPAPYNTLKLTEEEAIGRAVKAAGKTLVVFSGGSKITNDELFLKVRQGMAAGGNGLIFGRNMWQRPMDEALSISSRVTEIMKEFTV